MSTEKRIRAFGRVMTRELDRDEVAQVGGGEEVTVDAVQSIGDCPGAALAYTYCFWGVWYHIDDC